MTRIVQLANFYGPESGGLRTVLDELGRGYTAAGVERVLIVPGPCDTEEVGDWGTRITLASPRLPAGGGYHVMTARRRVTGLLDALRPDRVEVSDKLSLAWVGRWARERRIASVLFSHERLDAILAPRLPRCFPLGRAADARNRRLAASFDTIVCTSAFAQEEYDRIGATNVARVPLGVDLEVFRPFARHRSPRVELVCLGRLSTEKRPHIALGALDGLLGAGVDAHLTLIGGGPLAADLRRRAADRPVTFAGHVSDRQSVAALLAAADVTIAPCAVESFGLSVVESLACGTPVVVAAGGATRELIDDCCGRVATADMAGAVIDVLALPAARAAARARAERYPMSSTTAGMLAVHGLAGAMR